MLSSCDNPLEYRGSDAPDKLVVNSLMSVQDTLHFVQLAVSTVRNVKSVDNAALKCFVNGVLASETQELKEGRLYFPADLSAGDKVRLEVEADSRFSASAEVTVPRQTVIESISTETIKQRTFLEDSVTTYIRYNIRLQNPTREDAYYSVKIAQEYIPCIGRELLQPEVREDLVEGQSDGSIAVSNISMQHYYYLKALNHIASGSDDLALEDISIPDNVNGGIGFVGVSNITVTDVTP